MPPKNRSTRRLSDLARHVVIPSGIVSTDWPRFRNTIRSLGVGVDGWQDGIGQVTFGLRADGLYGHSVGGIVVTIPRQAGKTHIFSAIAFALCVLEPNTLVLWTAHHMKTSDETMMDMAGMARLPDIEPHVKKVLTGNSKPGVHFMNGSRILFGARERGFGRGMKRVKMIMLDEAQILSERVMEDMIATTNAIANPILVLAGTPPTPLDNSEVFKQARADALSGEHEDMFFVEFSADVDGDEGDRKQWEKANPSYPHRTNDAAIMRMRRRLTPDGFRREALGIWDDKTQEPPVFAPAVWAALEAPAPDDGIVTYGVKFSPDSVGVCSAVKPPDGPIWIQGEHHRLTIDGLNWLTEWMAEKLERAAYVAIDGRSFTGALVERLGEAKVPTSKIIQMSTSQAITSNGIMAAAIADKVVAHDGDKAVAASCAAAGYRRINPSGAWGFKSINGGDCTLFEAAVLAHFAADMAKQTRAPRKLY